MSPGLRHDLRYVCQSGIECANRGISCSQAWLLHYTDEGSLLAGLKVALPQIIDKSSRGGSLLDNAGGLLDLAKKFI